MRSYGIATSLVSPDLDFWLQICTDCESQLRSKVPVANVLALILLSRSSHAHFAEVDMTLQSHSTHQR
jgi:hypothetical protein